MYSFIELETYNIIGSNEIVEHTFHQTMCAKWFQYITLLLYIIYTLSPNLVDNSIGLKYFISSGLKNIKRITALRLLILTG